MRRRAHALGSQKISPYEIRSCLEFTLLTNRTDGNQASSRDLGIIPLNLPQGA